VKYLRVLVKDIDIETYGVIVRERCI